MQGISVELGGYAFGIVVGSLEHLSLLHKVDPDQKRRARASRKTDPTKEPLRLVRFEVADGRAREEEEEPPPIGFLLRGGAR